MLVRRSLTLAVGFLALILGVGCSKDLGHFANVSGIITHNGTPVDGAKVEFHGTAESSTGRAVASATTDSTGKYVIAGVGKEPGIPPGMYKVVITKYNTKDGTGKLPEGMDSGQIEAMISDTGARAASNITNLLPKEYATLGTSKLSVTLETGKNEGKDFDLKGK